MNEENSTKHEKKELKRKLKEEQELLKEQEKKKSKRTKNITFLLIGALALIIIISLIYNSSTKEPIIDNRYHVTEGQLVIEEFSDFQCPYCARAVPTIKQIKETYEDKVVIMYKHFPLGSHKFAFKSAEASECARDQNMFWEYHDKLFDNQDKLDTNSLKQYAMELNLNEEQFNKCLDSGEKKSLIEKDILEAQKKGITGTPSFIIDSKKLVGAQPFESFKQIIERKI